MSKKNGYFLAIFLNMAVVFFVSVGCNQKSDSKVTDDYPFPMYNTSSPLYKELLQSQLGCEDFNCESNRSDFEAIGIVGMLAKGSPEDNEFGLGQCTGFLYGSQEVVALNSHCITDSMWEHRDNCEEYLGIKFPAVPGHDEEIRMCDKILYRSDLKGESPFNVKADYAFFRIKKINRQALMLSNEPVKNQDHISFRKVNPLKNRLGGRLDYSYCMAQTESLLNSSYSNEWSDTGLGVSYGSQDDAKKCEIRKGNSGSPVLNIRNEVVGFAQSYVTEKFLELLKSALITEELKKQYKINMNLNFPEKLPDHFQFTQRVCIKDPLNLDAENLLCFDKRKMLAGEKNQELSESLNVKEVETYLKKIFEDINKLYPKFFELVIVKDKDFYRYQITPKCVLPEAQWGRENLSIRKANFFNTARRVVMMQKPIAMDLTVNLNLDKNLVYLSSDLSHTYLYGDFVTELSGNDIHVTKSYQPEKKSSLRKEELVPDVSWCH